MFTKKYHISIDTLPIANWNKCKEGELQYLYKCNFFEVPKKYPPNFTKIFEEMIYQLDHVDMTLIRLANLEAKYRNKFAVTGNHIWNNKANSTQSEIERLVKLNESKQGNNKFTDEVCALERWMNSPGSIDIYKMSTKSYMSHRNAFVKHIEQLESRKNG